MPAPELRRTPFRIVRHQLAPEIRATADAGSGSQSLPTRPKRDTNPCIYSELRNCPHLTAISSPSCLTQSRFGLISAVKEIKSMNKRVHRRNRACEQLEETLKTFTANMDFSSKEVFAHVCLVMPLKSPRTDAGIIEKQAYFQANYQALLQDGVTLTI